MELKEIKQIVELMNKHELSFFHLQKEDFQIKLKKGTDVEAISAALSQMPAPAPVAAAPAPVAAAPTAAAPAPAAADAGGGDEVAHDGEVFESPMVGTFYRSSSPDSDPFVKVGDEVNEDTTLCVVEAMKVFNEIKAEKKGVITKILVENAQPVQFGEGLFVIK